MSKTVTEKLDKMQIKVSDVEEKKTTLETNAKELVKQIQIKEQEIIKKFINDLFVMVKD